TFSDWTVKNISGTRRPAPQRRKIELPWLQFAKRSFALAQHPGGLSSLRRTARSLLCCAVHSGLLLHSYGSPLPPVRRGSRPDRRYSDLCDPRIPANLPATTSPPRGGGGNPPHAPGSGSGGAGGEDGSEMSGGGGGAWSPWQLAQTPL